MTTTIRSKYDNEEAQIARRRDGVALTLRSARGVILPRAEFIEAVATELDVIVTEKADLPEVTGDDDLGEWRVNGHPYVAVGAREVMIARAERQAHAWLAIAERVRNLPPEVDEAQVDALAKILREKDAGDAEGLARILLATGQVHVGGAR